MTTTRNTTKAEALRVQLEAIIDSSSLGEVLLLIGQVAGEKSEHVATDWQDCKLAKSWDRDATLIERLAGRMEN